MLQSNLWFSNKSLHKKIALTSAASASSSMNISDFRTVLPVARALLEKSVSKSFPWTANAKWQKSHGDI
eukprot:7545697-Pyramimonas_sp.AAC.1